MNRRQARPPQRGFTILEICVALGILLVVLATSIPFILSYRGKNSVNRAAEVTKAVVERAAEQAKTVGYPLPDDLKLNGLATAAVAQSTPGLEVYVRMRKRLTAGTAPSLVSKKELSSSSDMVIRFEHLGLVDLDTETSVNGVFVEFVERDASGIERVLACLPIDVNGEFVLHSTSANGTIRFAHGSYSRQLELTVRGSCTPDRR
jgi:type II secretory pathway pseudopilin PulG